jgi:hypothetical protein
MLLAAVTTEHPNSAVIWTGVFALAAALVASFGVWASARAERVQKRDHAENATSAAELKTKLSANTETTQEIKTQLALLIQGQRSFDQRVDEIHEATRTTARDMHHHLEDHNNSRRDRV